MNEVGNQATEGGVSVERPVLLREAREAAGLHIAALAAALKVPVPKLEALEAGRYQELPDLTFARALASSACRHLKVDPMPVLAQIPLRPSPTLGEANHAINAPFKPASDPPPFSPLSWLSKPAVLGAIALLLGALVIVFLPRVEPIAVVDGPGPAPAQPPAPSALVAEPLAAAPVQPGLAAGEQGDAPSGPTSTDEAPVAAGQSAALPLSEPGAAPASADPAPASAEPSASGPAPLLRLVATESSWAEVVNGTGTVVLQRLLQEGERVEFSAAPPYSVVLGRSEAVEVSVRGRPFETRSITRNNVARFEVK